MACKARNQDEDFETKLKSTVLVDFKTKMNTVKKMIKALEKEKLQEKFKMFQINDRLRFYTEADEYLLFKAKKTMKTAKPFSKWKLEKDMLAEPNVYKTYDELRAIIYNQYLKERSIPNKSIVPIDNIRLKYFNENVVAEHLKARGFTWLPLPGTEYSIIIEKPQQFYKRNDYLKTIMKFRQQGRPLVYIEQKHFTINGPVLREELNTVNQSTIYHVMAANRNGIISFRHDSHSYVSQEHRFLDSFIKDLVLPVIPTNSVIVIDKPNQVNGKPGEHSSRSVFIDWLEKNDISHDNNAHTAELYALVEKSKVNKDDRYNLDDLLRGYGVEVIRRPTETKNTSYFVNFWESAAYDNTVFNARSILIDVESLKERKDWERFEDNLIEKERKIYEEDMMMEEIIDKLMMMAKDGKITVRDTGFDLDTDKPDDEFLSSILIT